MPSPVPAPAFGAAPVPAPAFGAAPVPAPAFGAAPPARAAVAIDFFFDTGQHVRPGSAGLLGRNPSSADPSLLCTAIGDPDMSISKTHLEYGMDANGMWVKDRDSTNGSTITHPGGQPVALVPNQKTPAGVGDIVTIGNRVFRIDEVSA